MVVGTGSWTVRLRLRNVIFRVRMRVYLRAGGYGYRVQAVLEQDFAE